MTLELAAVPLALVAGVVGILSPCVWPLVPVVTSSAAMSGRTGPLYLAGGLSLSFAAAGTVLTFLLVSTGLDPEFFRYVSGALLIVIAAVLLWPALNDTTTLALSWLSNRLGAVGRTSAGSAPGQFGVGALLGVVWLPCVGPTLGAAIALASIGRNMGMAFLVMLAYGVGTAGVLLLTGLASRRLLERWRSRTRSSARYGKRLLGWSLLLLGFLVLTGFDKALEALATSFVPTWVFSL